MAFTDGTTERSTEVFETYNANKNVRILRRFSLVIFLVLRILNSVR